MLFFRCVAACGAIQVADTIADAVVLLTSEIINSQEERGISAPVIRNGRRGRPKFIIDEDLLENMLYLHFKVPRIAKLLGVSVRTIRRRMSEAGLYASEYYSTMSDEQLDVVVGDVLLLFPNSGYRMMAGHLKNRNLRVQQQRIRDSLHRVSPQSVAVRWHESLVRRVYSVSAPLALWHIDGNHKLIRCVLIQYSLQVHIYHCYSFFKHLASIADYLTNHEISFFLGGNLLFMVVLMATVEYLYFCIAAITIDHEQY